MEIIFFALALLAFIIFGVFMSIYSSSSSNAYNFNQSEVQMNTDAFFKMRSEIDSYTALQRENVPYAGKLVKLQGLVLDIRRNESKLNNDSKGNLYYIESLSISVEVSKEREKCKVYWDITWKPKKDNSEIPDVFREYKYLKKGSTISFKGKVDKRQYESGINLYYCEVIN